MQLEYAFLAKFADTNPAGGFTAVDGGIAVISGPKLPIAVPLLHLVAHFRFMREECGQRYNVLVQLVSPTGEPMALGDAVLPLTPALRADIPDQETTTATGVLGMLGAQFDTPGDYVFRLLLGGEALGSTAVRVHVTAPY